MKETIAAILLKTTKRRFLSLCASALLGLALLWLLNFIVNLSPDNKILKILEFLKIPEILEFLRIVEVLKIILDKLSILIVSLPTAIFLWWFRTHDVGQGLKQSKESYHQNEWVDGLNRLISDEPLNIDLGVKKLIDLSEKDNSYDEDIHLAFSKRLKHLPKKYEEEAQNIQKLLQESEDNAKPYRKQTLPYLTYAQHILKWFKAKNRTITDINGTRFDFQEFKLDVYKQAENPLVYFLGKDSSFKKITFIHANLPEVNLEGANLLGGSLPGADLPGANLEGADLQWANLLGANLSGAKLEEVNLLGANLLGANLEGANLSKVNLDGAKLSEGIMKYPREQ